MQGITTEEMKNNLARCDGLKCEGTNVSFISAENEAIRIDLRVKEPQQLVYLARLLAHLGYEEAHFAGAYLWLTTWGVWSYSDEAIGFQTFEQFRRSYGENRSVEAAPGTYFRHNEFTSAVCCLLPSMIVGWDAYFVPWWQWGTLDYFIFVSHDSFVDVVVRTKEMRDRALDTLGGHEWMKIVTHSK